MCAQQKIVGRAASSIEMGCHEGDEVWEASSDDGSSSCDSDSECDDVPRPQSESRSVPCSQMPKPPAAWQKAPDAVITPRRQVSFEMPSASREIPSDSLEPTHGLMELVAHLRRDNARLREALVSAQREAEEFAKESGQTQTVNFGHLLSLVKDFGTDGLGGGECSDEFAAFENSPVSTTDTLIDDYSDTQCAQVFSMCDDCEVDGPQDALAEETSVSHSMDLSVLVVENLNAPHSKESHDETPQLRKELEAMKREVETLRARLSTGDKQSDKSNASFFTTLHHEETRFVENCSATSVAVAA